MSKKKLRMVHYLNQFFGQIGGEEKADVAFSVKEGPVGPGVLLQKLLGEDGTIMATIICGDNYFAGNLDRASEEALKLVEPFKPDILFAGPAFAAGRYGLNCGEFCKTVGGKLGIPAITGMYQENPGVEIYRKDCYIAQTGDSAAKMAEAVNRMVSIARKVISTETHSKVLAGDQIGKPSEDEYFPRGVLRNEHTEKTAACRGLDMLLAKIKGQPFVSEVVMAKYDSIPPPPPVKDLKSCEVALVSDCGLCPKGNPHGLSGRGNKVWCTYETKDLFPEKGSLPEYEVAHTGYYPKEVLENPYRILPVDIMRELENEGIIGKFHPTYFCTSGNVTPNLVCHDMGEGIAAEIKKRQIGAVILTSTWGSSTRCGSTIGTRIENVGVPVVQITAVPPVAKMVGINRALRGQTITNLLGDSNLPPEKEKELRRKYVLRALEILSTNVQKPQMFSLDGVEWSETKWNSMKRTRNRIIATLITLTTGLLFASAGIAAEKAWLMSTSSAGTAGYACTMGFSSPVNKHTKCKLEAVSTPGSTASVRLFGKKECDFAYQSGWRRK